MSLYPVTYYLQLAVRLLLRASLTELQEGKEGTHEGWFLDERRTDAYPGINLREGVVQLRKTLPERTTNIHPRSDVREWAEGAREGKFPGGRQTCTQEPSFGRVGHRHTSVQTPVQEHI